MEKAEDLMRSEYPEEDVCERVADGLELHAVDGLPESEEDVEVDHQDVHQAAVADQVQCVLGD